MQIFSVTTSTGGYLRTFSQSETAPLERNGFADLTENCPIFGLVGFDPKFLAV